MSGASGRRWKKAAIVDDAVVARVRALAISWGSARRLSSVIGVERTTVDLVRAGQPLSPRTWRRVAAAIIAIPDSPPGGVVLPPIPKKSPLCARCGERRVYVLGLDGRRTICRDCRDAERSSGSTLTKCPHCGHRHASKLEADFCCILVPETRGHCGWCGDDCARSYCGKNCSISYHSDASGGEYGEAMVRSSEVAAE